MATSYALDFDISRDFAGIQQQAGGVDQNRKAELEKVREVLQIKQEQIKELVRKTPELNGAQLEELRRMEQDIAVATSKLDFERQINSPEKLREMKEVMQAYERERPQREEQFREMRNRYNEILTQYPGDNGELMKSLQQQFKDLVENQVKEKADRLDKLKTKERKLEVEEESERAMEDERERSETSEDLVDRAARDAERAEISKRQLELTRLATLSMDRAIQVASSRYPGKVVSCSLGRSKDGTAHYRVIIINTEGETTITRHVWVSASDGQIIKTELE